MAYEVITLNLIPSGEVPVIHAAQFDKARPLMFALKLGEDDFNPSGYDLELHIRKVDNNIVTAAPTSVLSNVVTFNSTEQMTACSGTNLGEIQITKDDFDIATLHFYLVVQRDVLAGGVTSESDIYNLTGQIAAIVPQVIGNDYYNKEEVDEKIAEIPTFDPTNYYDKSDVDALLNDKADVSDLPDMSNYYTKTEVDNKITGLYEIKTASGSLVHITDGGNNIPLKSFESYIVAVETGSGEKSPSNPYTISGFSSGVVSVNSNTYTFAFGQTVYGGHFDNKGNLVVTHEYVDLASLSWTRTTNYTNPLFYASISDKKYSSVNSLCEIYGNGGLITGTTALNNMQDNTFGAGNNANVIYVRDDSCSDVPSFETAVSGKYFVYELATPITLAITSQDIPTLLGENNIFSNCGDIEVEYFTEKSDGIAELIKAFM